MSFKIHEKQKKIFDLLQVESSWRYTQGNDKIIIGVIDTGFDFFHPDLKKNIIPGYYNNCGYHTETYEITAHGTMVASLIAANSERNGIKGLVPNCKILSASTGMIKNDFLIFYKDFFKKHPNEMKKFQEELANKKEFDSYAINHVNYFSNAISDAIIYLTDKNVKVINISSKLSLSAIENDIVKNKLLSAFEYAKNHNVLIITSSGNNSELRDDYPGNKDTVMVCGAILDDDKRWETITEFQGGKIKMGSDYGSRLSVMAPVENLLVCAPHERRFYKIKNGPSGDFTYKYAGNHIVSPNGATSLAAPIVTSLAALLLSIEPDLKISEIIDLIQNGCVKVSDNKQEYGFGRINFYNSVKLLLDGRKNEI